MKVFFWILSFFAMNLLAGAADAQNAAGKAQTQPAAAPPAQPAQGQAIQGGDIADHNGPLVTVNGKTITKAEYYVALQQAARNRFYHGKVPDNEVAQLRQEVVRNLVVEELLKGEAERRKVKADKKQVDEQIAAYEKRYANSQEWKQKRNEVLPVIRERLELDSKLGLLKKSVEDVKAPSEAKLKAYYDANPAKFTEPTRQRVSLILLGVEPSAPVSAWQKAKAEAELIHKQLKGGADFAETAQLRSSDGSAGQGGDMGYLHKGMLADAAQEVIDRLKVGDVSEPIELLQGFAIFKLTERQPERKMPLAEVKDRAVQLYERETKAALWNEFVGGLIKGAKVSFDPSAPVQSIDLPKPPGK